jgi:flavin reductase
MGGAVTGVTVVTTDGPAGRFGQTVSAMASVSADPPALLVCINRRSPIAAAIEENGWFAVSALAAGQTEVANTFAGRPEAGPAYDFDEDAWEFTGVPTLRDASAVFVCERDVVVDQGTHAVVFGRVESAWGGDAPALCYTRRAYSQPAPV